ncbi:MAG: hypothetical protein K2Q13_08630 [Nitrosomonas sp.]|uniref:hypothetical protein n=1 Tax=Nitrosomonas sp. TaxID=42353 RepID=UPI0025DCB6AD|nr:hypothetical protein [Nitrosomonas sp.]MBY0475107.1 hypothetical protein [Nitrosomonas sp.]
MKGDTEVVVMIILFFAGAFFAAFAEDVSLLPFINTLIAPLATLVAAFFGAKYAFKLQAQQKQEETYRTEVEAGNKVIFQLIRLHNKFGAIREQFIEKYRDNSGRHYLIQPIAGLDIKDPHINYDSLSFIFNSGELNILTELSSFEQEIASAIEVISRRSDHHYRIIQPAVEQLEKEHGKEITLEKIDSILGKREAQIAKMSTDNMIMCVDSIMHYDKLIIKLSNLMKGLYKGHTIISMSIHDSPN